MLYLYLYVCIYIYIYIYICLHTCIKFFDVKSLQTCDEQRSCSTEKPFALVFTALSAHGGSRFETSGYV